MFITTCPSCKSKFRITEQHLSAADGLVVCSSCHNIFQANDSLQQMPTATQKAAPNVQSQAVQKPVAPSAAQTMQKPAENTPPPQPEPQIRIEPKVAEEKPKKKSFFSSLFGSHKHDEADVPYNQSAEYKAEKAQIEQEKAEEKAKKETEDKEWYANLAEKEKAKAERLRQKEEKKQAKIDAKEQAKAEKEAAAEEKRKAEEEARAKKQAEEEEKKKQELEEQKAAEETPPPPEFNAVNEPQMPPPALNDFSQMPPPFQQPINPHFLPGMMPTGQVPMPPAYYGYNPMPNPYHYPPPPAEPPATRDEFNWTVASLVALIVLIMQLFYIILQMK
ncbi:MAG: zinc-ribbon domain-containing protein [Neisseriaceae bacterium]|nr:zinc-ribbon domain-containing protein [Neisseriaceae bacterium]